MKAAWVAACSLIVFGLTVDQVLWEYKHTERDLDLVELWSGRGTLVLAARDRGLQATGFDKAYHDSQDITTLHGFRAALNVVFRLKPGALLWQGVVCSSFTFPNSSRCRRTRWNLAGDGGYDKVRTGHLMAQIVGFFMVVCVARAVESAIENPKGSHIFGYMLQWLHCIRELCWQICHRCAYDSEP